MILHIPHSSIVVPSGVRSSLLPDDPALERELLTATDWFTDDLFDFAEARRVVFPVSRLVADPERFIDDDLEPMAARGRGVIYTRTVDGARLRHSPSAQERERLLEAYYQPHHRLLEDAVDDELAKSGRALIVDCHSYPSFPTSADQYRDSPVRPEFCLGTDDYHTPAVLTECLHGYLTEHGYEVAINVPFSGTIVPLSRYRKDPRVRSIMIEIRRDIYMNERTGEKSKRFVEIRRLVDGLLGVLKHHV